MTWYDVRFAAVVMSGLILLELGKEKYSPLVNKYNLQRYFGIVLILLIGIQSYNLLNSDLKLVSLEKLDQSPSRNWETNVFEVIHYLNNSEKANVLSVRAPAIPFFTNRTNFDIFSPQTFAYTASPLLLTDNSSAFKKKIADLGIRYIVIPNESNPLYYVVRNSGLESKLVPFIGTSEDFQKITLQNFTVYKYNPNFEK